MKVVKVDGNVFLAEVADNVLTDAKALGHSNLSTDVSLYVFAEYLQAKNLKELVTVEFGTTSAFSSRDLNNMEKHAFGNAEFSMSVAKDLAVRDLENMYFGKLVKGK
jgi:hypothetical protein